MKTIDEMSIVEQMELIKEFDALADRVKLYIFEEMREYFKLFMSDGLFRYTLSVAGYAFNLRSCESPIEQLLYLAMNSTGLGMSDGYITDIIPQKKIELEGKEYRVDFLIEYSPSMFSKEIPIKRLVIECDGHDFHERTKVQAQRDKARDRIFQKHGYNVLRFTGSEIYREPLDCANEIKEFIKNTVGV